MSWHPVPGFPFEVTRAGAIRRAGGARCAVHYNEHGYACVKQGRRTHLRVNRLVCLTFHGPPPSPRHHADHDNGVRSDNSAANLQWLSPEENRAKRRVVRGEAHHDAKLTESAVRAILASSLSHVALAERYGVSRRAIYDVRSGRTWKHISSAEREAGEANNLPAAA